MQGILDTGLSVRDSRRQSLDSSSVRITL